jgi:hypothetical protein
MVQVPALKGTSEAQARLAITEAGLKLTEPVTYHSDPDSTAGTVLDQVPPAGTTVRTGAPVTLIVNKGVEVASVPDLVGSTKDDAARILRRNGLLLGKTTEQFSNTMPVGQVLAQSVPAGTRIQKGDAVDVTVSQGPETELPPGEALTPGGTAGSGDVPDVVCNPDSRYRGADPRQRRYLLTITGKGDKKGQHIRVTMHDESGPSQLVTDGTIDPGVSKPIPIVGEGTTSISVYHEGQKVADFNFKVPLGGTSP